MAIATADTSKVKANSSGAWKALAKAESSKPMPRTPANISTTRTPRRAKTIPRRIAARTAGTIAGRITRE